MEGRWAGSTILQTNRHHGCSAPSRLP